MRRYVQHGAVAILGSIPRPNDGTSLGVLSRSAATTAGAEILLRPCSGAVPSKLGCVRERQLGFFSIKSLPNICACGGRSSRALVTLLVVRGTGVQAYRDDVVHAMYMMLLGITDRLCFSCMRWRLEFGQAQQRA